MFADSKTLADELHSIRAEYAVDVYNAEGCADVMTLLEVYVIERLVA